METLHGKWRAESYAHQTIFHRMPIFILCQLAPTVRCTCAVTTSLSPD